MKKLSGTLFILICLCFSAVLLVLSMVGSAELAAVSERVGTLEKEISALAEENRILTAEAENRLGLETIETLASERLGMRRPSPEQIIYIR